MLRQRLLSDNMSTTNDENKPPKGWFKSLGNRLSSGNLLHSSLANQRTSLGFSKLANSDSQQPGLPDRRPTPPLRSPFTETSATTLNASTEGRASHDTKKSSGGHVRPLLMNGFGTSMSSNVGAVLSLAGRHHSHQRKARFCLSSNVCTCTSIVPINWDCRAYLFERGDC